MKSYWLVSETFINCIVYCESFNAKVNDKRETNLVSFRKLYLIKVLKEDCFYVVLIWL